MVVPTNYGLVLRWLELSSVGDFQRRVEERSDELEPSMETIDRLVHDARESNA